LLTSDQLAGPRGEGGENFGRLWLEPERFPVLTQFAGFDIQIERGEANTSRRVAVATQGPPFTLRRRGLAGNYTTVRR
jgi:hypothetical protein